MKLRTGLTKTLVDKIKGRKGMKTKTKKEERMVGIRLGVMFLTAVTALASFLPAYQALAWGPARETFTMEVPASYPTFNSITNNPVLGDERNFVLVAEAGANGVFVDEIKIEAGKEYEVYIGYHNNAAANLNSTGVGIAQQVRLSSQFPATVKPSQKGKISAIISASNTNPTEVWDEAYFTSTEEITLRYKEGSAKIYNSFATNGQVLSENLFSVTGTYLGVNKLDGLMPGCAEYSGRVIYTLVAEKEALEVDKKASLDGNSFSESVTAEVGQEITYKVTFRNTGNTDLTNVTFHDKLPAGLSLVPGSTYLDGEQLTDLIDKNGYNTGLYGPGTTATLTYKVKVNENAVDNGNCGANNFVNTIYVDHDGGETTDGATVIVNRACTPTELPETGPGEIALAVVAILCVGVGGTYWYRSRKTLKRVTNSVEGKQDQ